MQLDAQTNSGILNGGYEVINSFFYQFNGLIHVA